MLDLLRELLADEPCFVLLTCHDHRWPSTRLREALEEMVTSASDGTGSELEHGRMVLRATEATGRDLPMGAFARWRRIEPNRRSI